jgi:hypothetical protein
VPGSAAHLERALRGHERSEESLEQRALGEIGLVPAAGSVPAFIAGGVALEELPHRARLAHRAIETCALTFMGRSLES